MSIPFPFRTDPRLAPVSKNRRPSSAAVAAAQALGKQIVQCVEDRRKIMNSGDSSVDRDFALPAANWDSAAPNDYQLCYQRLAALTWDELRFLRLRSQSFSGNSLIRMDEGRGTSGNGPFPEDFEHLWSNARRDGVIAHWRMLKEMVPRRLLLNVPNILGETGWWVGRFLVNVDVVDYQERINLLFLSGVFETLERRPRILEIGGGYGALALALCSILGPRQYVICDLPESLLFSGLYLRMAQNHPVRLHASAARLAVDRGEICLVPNYFAQETFMDQHFDLVINTLSLSEMTEYQVRTYAAMVSKAIGTTGRFFEQNHDNRHLGLIDCRDYLNGYFRQKTEIDPGKMSTTRGTATIWSN